MSISDRALTPELLEALPEVYDSAGLVKSGVVKSFVTLTTLSFPGVMEQYSDSIRWDAQARQTSRGSSLSPELEEELERTNPAVLSWLRSTSGQLFQVSLICAYISLETFCALLNSFVLNPASSHTAKPLPSSMIVMNSGLSIMIGLLITAGSSVFSEKTPITQVISKTCRTVFQWRQVLAFSIAGGLFSISAVFTMMAYSKVDAGLKKILDQLRLPLTAALSSVIIGKRYSAYEWMTLLLMLLAVWSFYLAQVDHDGITQLHTKCRYPSHCFSAPPYDICALRIDGAQILGVAVKDKLNGTSTLHDISTFPVKAKDTDWRGFIFCLLAAFFNCMGSLFSEKVLKSTASTPFPTQKVREETTGFPVAIALSFILPLWVDSRGGKAIWWTKTEADGSGEGFFQGYTRLTLVAIALDITAAWMGGIIVKHFSSLVKVMSKCFVLLLTVICSGTFLKACQANSLPMTMYSLALMITLATLLFAIMQRDKAAQASQEVLPPSEPCTFQIQEEPLSAIQLQHGDVQATGPRAFLQIS